MAESNVGSVEDHRGTSPKLRRASDLHEQLETIRQEATKYPGSFKRREAVEALDSLTVSASYMSIEKLRRVNFNEFEYGSRVVDGYILVRVLEPGVITMGWMSVVEDDQGNSCLLEVNNYPPRELFHVGTVLIIKEPYVKRASPATIRCDCPTDIVVLRRSHQLYCLAEAVEWKNQLSSIKEQHELILGPPDSQPASAWMSLGDELFYAGDLPLAMECYFVGVKACSETDSIRTELLTHLCSAYFGLGFYENIIPLAEVSLNKTALLVLGKVFYQLRRYRDAENTFKILHANYRDDVYILSELTKSTLRNLERIEPDRFISYLMSERAINPYKELDFADYTGSVKITLIQGNRRGIVLTKDVEAQTILMVSKAFVASLDPTKPSTSEIINLELVSELAQAITTNPKSYGEMIYALSTVDEPIPKAAFNTDPPDKGDFICDVQRIKAIWRCNRFPILYKVDGIMKDVGAGLFIWPSYAKRRFDPNSDPEFYNDVMVVRSRTPLKAGDEMFIGFYPSVYLASSVNVSAVSRIGTEIA